MQTTVVGGAGLRKNTACMAAGPRARMGTGSGRARIRSTSARLSLGSSLLRCQPCPPSRRRTVPPVASKLRTTARCRSVISPSWGRISTRVSGARRPLKLEVVDRGHGQVLFLDRLENAQHRSEELHPECAGVRDAGVPRPLADVDQHGTQRACRGQLRRDLGAHRVRRPVDPRCRRVDRCRSPRPHAGWMNRGDAAVRDRGGRRIERFFLGLREGNPHQRRTAVARVAREAPAKRVLQIVGRRGERAVPVRPPAFLPFDPGLVRRGLQEAAERLGELRLARVGDVQQRSGDLHLGVEARIERAADGENDLPDASPCTARFQSTKLRTMQRPTNSATR